MRGCLVNKKTVYIDVTNLYLTRSITGIQRVVRSLLPFFLDDDSLIVKVLFFDKTRNKFAVFNNSDMLHFATSLQHTVINPDYEIDVSDIKKDDIFFDVDSVWNVHAKRSWLYPQLKKNGVIIYAYVYDLIPFVKPAQIHPNTLRNFLMFMAAVFTYADQIFTDSRSTERDLVAAMDEAGVNRYIPIVVTRLGSDFNLKTKNEDSTVPAAILKKKYILFVGTLEPRKHQALLLNSFIELMQSDDTVHLVYVGKKGWLNDAFINTLTSHPAYNKRIHWLQNADDYAVESLYKNSYLTVYISNYEGYGLPIAEALKYNKPIICSNNSSMYEVGTDFADYIQYNTVDELTAQLKLYLEDSKFYKSKIRKIKKYFQPITWQDVYRVMRPSFVIQNNSLKEINTPKKLQHVCISIRPDDFQRCVERTDKYVDFVKEYIVVTKPELIKQYQAIHSKHTIIVIDERQLLKDKYTAFTHAPHQMKNWFLRSSLPNAKNIDEEFIMLDDDNLPLEKITIDHFVHKGRYRAYYYNDLHDFKYSRTNYDQGQHDTAEVLYSLNLEMLSYSSHMPQIINKSILREVIDIFNEVGKQKNLDEWSTYFNYATMQHPHIFEKRPYQTLNWPAHPNDWTTSYKPRHYTYENYYDHIYDESGVFAELTLSSHKKDKLHLKELQYVSHQKTQKMMSQAKDLCRIYSAVHGRMVFTGINGDKVVLNNIPYVFAGVPDVVQWLDVAFKIIRPKKKGEYELILQNSAGATKECELVESNSYGARGLREGIVKAPLHIAETGAKDLNFAVRWSFGDQQEELQPLAHRYDSVVIVAKQDQSFDEALNDINDDEIQNLSIIKS